MCRMALWDHPVLQYLDVPLPSLLDRLPERPRHLLLNKVATREGDSVLTLENFGLAEVTYRIRDRSAFDQWEIESLSHRIPARPDLGASRSLGFALEGAR